jgi:hypothetical protein
MDNTSLIFEIIIYTMAAIVIVGAYIKQYIGDKDAIKEQNRRNDLRMIWMRQDVDERIKADMEFERYRLMRDIEKIKV